MSGIQIDRVDMENGKFGYAISVAQSQIGPHAVDDHAHQKPRPDRQCRLDIEIALNDFLPDLVRLSLDPRRSPVMTSLLPPKRARPRRKWHRIKESRRCATARLRPPRVPCLEGSVPPHNRPYLLAKPPPGRRHPVKAVSREAGRAIRASLEGMAPVWPHSYKQVTVLWTLISPAPVSCRNSIRCRRHRALCR
jgi:hypothetical protein